MIRQSLLAILDQEPCYGYQLRLEFERRTGGTWPLNVGQVYTTLDRLERDGLVATGATDAEGHVYYEITPAGRDAARGWLATPVERPLAARDELAVKLALALTLPGADAAAILTTQRDATTAALARYRAEPNGTLARQLVVDSLVFAAEAELAWLEHCEARLGDAVAFAIDAGPVRRGRPSRV
ncbi:MAG: PadR family transcriptional regulator [Pseudolysinimonas sp.]